MVGLKFNAAIVNDSLLERSVPIVSSFSVLLLLSVSVSALFVRVKKRELMSDMVNVRALIEERGLDFDLFWFSEEFCSVWLLPCSRE